MPAVVHSRRVGWLPQLINPLRVPLRVRVVAPWPYFVEGSMHTWGQWSQPPRLRRPPLQISTCDFWWRWYCTSSGHECNHSSSGTRVCLQNCVTFSWKTRHSYFSRGTQSPSLSTSPHLYVRCFGRIPRALVFGCDLRQAIHIQQAILQQPVTECKHWWGTFRLIGDWAKLCHPFLLSFGWISEGPWTLQDSPYIKKRRCREESDKFEEC